MLLDEERCKHRRRFGKELPAEQAAVKVWMGAELGTRQFFSFATTRQRNIASGISHEPEKIEK